MMNMRLWALPILLLCLCVNSWGACTSSNIQYTSSWVPTSNSEVDLGTYTPFSGCPNGTNNFTTIASCSGQSPLSIKIAIKLSGSCGPYYRFIGTSGECQTYPPYNRRGSITINYVRCDTQAEADSAACELKPGMHWVNGICSAPVCESSCSSQKASCTNWKDSVTYDVDAETGDTTFSCVGYCKMARMTHSDSVEAMDDSLSIIYRKNFAYSVKVNYGVNCASPADTTVGGNPQEVGMTYFVDFNNVENELDTAGVSFIKGLYNQSCESTLYRGIKNGRYVFWYSPNDIPEGVTNVVRIR